jgi:hypothetical protein
MLKQSLLRESDLMQTIVSILTEWEGEGAAGAIPASALKEYVRRLLPDAKDKQLYGPRRSTKTAGVPRYVFATIPVARLLSSRRAEIQALLDAHYEPDRQPAPTK